MSRAAAGLVRSLINRGGAGPDRILLIDVRSVDWQSLTFTGERHAITLRVTGPGSDSTVRLMTDGLADAEFAIPGSIVADIAATPVVNADDASVLVAIEALTISE
jgi:hypothetical protein